MRVSLVPFVLLLSCANRAIAAGEAPKASPPQFAIVQSVGRNGGPIQVTYAVWKPVYETKTVNVQVKNTVQTQTIVVAREVPEQRVMECNPRDLKVVNAKGDALSKDEVHSKLKPGTPIVISYDGKTPDAYYRQFLKPDVLILVLNRPNPANRSFIAPNAKGFSPQPIPQAAPTP